MDDEAPIEITTADATDNIADDADDAVTADDDAIFVCGGVGGYMQTWYELIELTR